MITLHALNDAVPIILDVSTLEPLMETCLPDAIILFRSVSPALTIIAMGVSIPGRCTEVVKLPLIDPVSLLCERSRLPPLLLNVAAATRLFRRGFAYIHS